MPHVVGNLYEDQIVGTISANGDMFVDFLGIKFVGGVNDGLVWGVYETTWTKTSKKATTVYPPADQVKELKLER